MKSWVLLSIAAFVFFSLMSLLLARNIKTGVPTHFVLLVVGIGFVVVYGAMSLASPPNTTALTRNVWLALTAAAVCSIVANLAMYRATITSPNPALAVAIGGSQAIGVAVLGYFLFGTTLTLMQLSGLVLATLGIALMVVGKG